MRWASERQRMNRRLINVVYPASRASNIRAYCDLLGRLRQKEYSMGTMFAVQNGSAEN